MNAAPLRFAILINRVENKKCKMQAAGFKVLKTSGENRISTKFRADRKLFIRLPVLMLVLITSRVPIAFQIFYYKDIIVLFSSRVRCVLP